MRPFEVVCVGVVVVALLRFALVEIGVDFAKHPWIFLSMWGAVGLLAIVASHYEVTEGRAGVPAARNAGGSP
jgi:hypothetical protein